MNQPRRASPPEHVPTPLQQGVENVLLHFPRTMGVCVGQGGALRRTFKSEMNLLSKHGIKAANYLTKRMRLTEVAKLTSRDVATVSHAVGRLRKRLLNDNEEARKINSVLRVQRVRRKEVQRCKPYPVIKGFGFLRASVPPR